MYIKDFSEKIDNMNFKLKNKLGEYEVTVSVMKNEDDNSIQITIDTNSSLGHNCIFNETYSYDEDADKFFENLHEQNLEDIENFIYDFITPTQEQE